MVEFSSLSPCTLIAIGVGAVQHLLLGAWGHFSAPHVEVVDVADWLQFLRSVLQLIRVPYSRDLPAARVTRSADMAYLRLCLAAPPSAARQVAGLAAGILDLHRRAGEQECRGRAIDPDHRACREAKIIIDVLDLAKSHLVRSSILALICLTRAASYIAGLGLHEPTA